MLPSGEVASFETSADALVTAIRKREITVQDATSHFLTRIAQSNGTIGAVRHTMSEAAMEAAGLWDKRIRSGEGPPPLIGLPVVVKENCDTVGVRCSAGLSFRNDHAPAVDSDITRRLREAGAIILGVSVSDPGAFSVRTPDVTHPVDPALTVGGSSGGSAAALASGFCLGAIGSDTGGSIRIPSACCGTAGLKPTYGAWSKEGVFPLVPSLDHIGPMARTASDVRLIWQALTQPRKSPARTVRKAGFDQNWVAVADPQIREAFARGLDMMQARGIEIVEVTLPDLDEISAMHGQIFIVEAAALHCAQHADDIASYPALARDWFAAARDIKLGTYVDACRKRHAMKLHIDRILGRVDAIVTPTIAVSRASKIGNTLEIAGQAHDYTMALVRMTSLFNHTGHPAVAFPIPDTGDSLSASIQLVGPWHAEAMLLDLAGLLERGA
ncbi:amidase [Rhizobium sp. NPDC090275]|uniref:amidase n=1 Tax=Rhizobium sp. NPDC090275 TaxID=3364498 RepID=UPI00383B4898